TTFHSMALWMTAYGQDSSYWHPLTPGTLGRAIIGFGRGLIGGTFLFALPPAAHWLTAHLTGYDLDDQIFLVRQMPLWLAGLLCGLTTGFGVVLGMIVWRARRG